jgi:hypothetical protein
MKNADAVSALAALAQENRLDAFRLLVQAGSEGMPAGAVARIDYLTENCCKGSTAPRRESTAAKKRVKESV